MPQGEAVEALRQQREEGGKVVAVKALGRRELPEDRPELRSQLMQAAPEKAVNRGLRFGQYAPVRGVARALHREHEIVRRLIRPLAEARGLLRRIEGTVDLYAGELAAGVLQLARLRPFLWIEYAAPRLIDPAADADADHCDGPPAIPTNAFAKLPLPRWAGER